MGQIKENPLEKNLWSRLISVPPTNKSIAPGKIPKINKRRPTLRLLKTRVYMFYWKIRSKLRNTC